MTSADDEPPIQTLLDLWYTAHGERGVYFTYEALQDGAFDDWLMRYMALVALRILRGESGKWDGAQRVVPYSPYRVSVYANKQKLQIRVAVFMEVDDGDS